MATKTVVCPECGSTAAPGRYACSECGALLAAVALTPRAWTPDDEPAHGGTRAAGEAAAAIDEPIDGDVATMTAGSSSDDATDAPEPATGAGPVTSLAFDEDAPLGSDHEAHEVAATATPDVLHDLDAAIGQEATAIDVRTDGGEPPDDDADAPPRDLPAASAAEPAWPPLGDRGPIPPPAPRTPAGSYLPPSAILPPSDGLLSAGDLTGSTPAHPGSNGASAVPSAPHEPLAPSTSMLGSASAAIAEALESVRVTADASRRAVAVGAGIATLGLVLPWVNSQPGANPFTGYLDRWGLAGPGMWLVLLGLLALIAVAGSPSATASWPVGLVAVGSATFLVGLVWPYLMGGSSRSIGVWVVLVGAFVLAIAGVLDRRTRHDPEEPTV